LLFIAALYLIILSLRERKRRKLNPDEVIKVNARLLGFRIFYPGEIWRDKRLKDYNGYYCRPVYSLRVDGDEIQVVAANKDAKLTKDDIGKIFSLTYHPANRVLLSSNMTVEGYLKHLKFRAIVSCMLFVAILGIPLVIFL